jgi:hypothetical protein
MDSTIHSTASHQGTVGGIHYGIDAQLRDVSLNNLYYLSHNKILSPLGNHTYCRTHQAPPAE